MNVNDDELFAADKYKRIMHNINNEGMYTDYIFEEDHDDYTVPNIFTQEEDDEIMKEFNKKNVDTDTQAARWIDD